MWWDPLQKSRSLIVRPTVRFPPRRFVPYKYSPGTLLMYPRCVSVTATSSSSIRMFIYPPPSSATILILLPSPYLISVSSSLINTHQFVLVSELIYSKAIFCMKFVHAHSSSSRSRPLQSSWSHLGLVSLRRIWHHQLFLNIIVARTDYLTSSILSSASKTF